MHGELRLLCSVLQQAHRAPVLQASPHLPPHLPAGFFLFLFLTMWIMRTPPTPLLFSPAQLDQLWHSVAGSMGQVGDNLHSLQHQLQDSLNSGMHTLEETMHSLQVGTGRHGCRHGVEAGMALGWPWDDPRCLKNVYGQLTGKEGRGARGGL